MRDYGLLIAVLLALALSALFWIPLFLWFR